MKIKMLTINAGPDTSQNWNEGQIRTVCDDEGNYWIQKGVAVLYEKSVIAPVEKAMIAPVQKAVIAPPEVSEKGKVKAESVKQPVAHPASSGGTVSSAKGPTWGTPGVK